MESSDTKQQQADAGKPGRTHWRRRDPAATAVYVVHPDQFRAVVQQLTGGSPSPPPASHGHHQGGTGSGTVTGSGGAAASNGAVAQPPQQRGGGSGGRSGQRTLGQMYEECMAWANADDDDY
ncbi:hypothetical protein ACP70R_019724 [Stipagrostis hirtigluma subsp. patula]